MKVAEEEKNDPAKTISATQNKKKKLPDMLETLKIKMEEFLKNED